MTKKALDNIQAHFSLDSDGVFGNWSASNQVTLDGMETRLYECCSLTRAKIVDLQRDLDALREAIDNQKQLKKLVQQCIKAFDEMGYDDEAQNVAAVLRNIK